MLCLDSDLDLQEHHFSKKFRIKMFKLKEAILFYFLLISQKTGKKNLAASEAR